MTEENKHKVIIVDDDDFLVDMYVTKFSSAGITVEVCKSGQMLLDKLKGGYKADAILLDVVMPGLNGIETLQEIRNANLADGIPVIMLTNQNNETDIKDAKILNVSGYIVKSAITPSDLVAEVMSIINSKPSKK